MPKKNRAAEDTVIINQMSRFFWLIAVLLPLNKKGNWTPNFGCRLSSLNTSSTSIWLGVLVSWCHWLILTPSLSIFSVVLSRYARVAGGEGAPTFHHDWSADQSEGAAPLCPWWAEENGRLTDGEAKTTDGIGQAAARAGTKGLRLCVFQLIYNVPSFALFKVFDLIGEN